MFLSQNLFPRDMAPKFCGRQAEEIYAGAFASKDAGRVRLSRSFRRGRQFWARIEVFQRLAAPFPGTATSARGERGEERTAGAPAAGLSAGRHFRARIAGFQRLAAPFRGAMRLVAEPEPMRTAVALLEAFSHPAAFPLSASSTKRARDMGG